MSKNISNVMLNLMGYLLYQLRLRDMPVDEFHMQKLIYKIKMGLGEGHELYPKLPFYWYLKGPYSDVVTESFNRFIPKCNVIGDSLLYKDNVFRNYNQDNSLISRYPAIENLSYEIMDDKNFFYNHLDKEIYREYAPYNFMYLYKYEIYDVAKSVEVVNFDVDKYMDKLYRCEAKLPIPEYFNEFKSYYSNFTSKLGLINLAGNFNKYWDELREPIILIWESFAKGIRVKFQDEYYNSQIDQWESDFKDSLNELSLSINKMEFLINSKDYSPKEYSDKQKRLAKLTFDNYMGR